MNFASLLSHLAALVARQNPHLPPLVWAGVVVGGGFLAGWLLRHLFGWVLYAAVIVAAVLVAAKMVGVGL